MLADGRDDLRWSTPTATGHYELTMKEAARETRDRLIFAAPDLPGALQLVARGVARAVWRQDVALATQLTASSQHAIDALVVEGSQ
eukprot:307346-Pyramimonas_sp.AAC.1